jgi:hypothetical protein
MRRRWQAEAAVLALAVAMGPTGCGGAGGIGPNRCLQLSPCGGDVVGNWAASGSCLDSAAVLSGIVAVLDLRCPAGVHPTVVAVTVQRDITGTFMTDGSYQATIVNSGALELQVPTSCFGGGTCAELQTGLGVFVSPGAGTVGVTCGGSDPCTCTLPQGGTTDESGTYSVSGTTLRTVTAAGTATDTPYCVDGRYLHLLNLGPDGVTPTGDTVVARP